MPQIYPCLKPFGRFFLRSLFVFIAFLFSSHSFGELAPAPQVTSTGFIYTYAGATITINGNYFTGATAVLIGGNGDTPAASFTVVSDNQIQAVIARGTQSGWLKVITPSGSSATGSLIVSVMNFAIIDDLTPASGTAGTVVTINGYNFSDATAVSFGGTPAASFTIVSNTVIRAVVASGSTGQVNIKNSAGNGFGGSFTYTAATPIPNITSFTPLSGTTGATLTIKGNYFTGATGVTIGGVAASSFNVESDNTITAVVASGASSGAVTVTTPGGPYSLDGFTYVAPDVKPHISSFTPGSASPRTTITIKGTNFTGATQVTFGGTPASSFSVVSDTEISAVVFSGSTGAVKVTTPGGVDSLGGFTYIPAPPEVTLVQPFMTAVGNTITITGNFFTSATAVLLGGNGDTPAASFTVVSDNQIQAVIARGTQAGFIKVITPAGSSAPGSSSDAFLRLIQVPYIDSITPTRGSAGTVVTIKGYNFTSTKAVSLGGTAVASYTIVSDTILQAVVGAGSTGQVRIDNSEGYRLFGNFTYTAATPIPNITSFAPVSGTTGTTVTIKGNYFTGATGVTIGGVAASSFNVESDNTITAVVASGASSGAVTVTTPGGPYSLDGFTYVAPDVKPHISSFTPGSASPRTTITIKGANFTGATQVSFGGTPASSFSVVSDTEIAAVVFSGSSGAVKVITPGGVDSLGGFTYIPAPPEVTSSGQQITVWGSTITIKGNFFTGTTAVSLGGNNGDTPAASFKVISDNELQVVIARGTQAGYVKITTPAGSIITSSYSIALFFIPYIDSFTPISGTTGTLVTIKGAFFSKVSAVSFGGTPAASFTILSDSTIQAIVGAGSTGDVKLIDGGSSGSLGTFNYISTVKPIPQITSFTPASGTEGSVVIIKGHNFTNATAVSFGGTPASSFTVTDSVITAQVGAGATGVVKVTTNNGSDTMGVFTYMANMMLTTPNPATGSVVVQHPVSTNNAVIKLANSMGNIVKNIKIVPGNSQTKLDLTGVAPGIYTIWWGDGANAFSKTVLIR